MLKADRFSQVFTVFCCAVGVVSLLATTRGRFNRSSSLFGERFTATWLVSVGIVMIVASWVLFFAVW